MSCNLDNSLTSLNLRTQSLYFPCTPLIRSGFPGAGLDSITNPTARAEALRTALVSAYGATVGDFEIFSDILYLRLPCDRSNYKPNHQYPYGEPSYNRSLSRRAFFVRSYLREVECNIIDERAPLYYLMDDISKATLAPTLRTKTELLMIDAVMPEATDYRIAIANNANPYTLRLGVLKLVTPNGGSAGRGIKRAISGGFNFKFEEATPKQQ